MPDAKTLHNTEQSQAFLRSMGAGLGDFYHELIEKGVHAEHARDITVEYVHSLWGQIKQPPPKEG